jgi:hypothetical protein
MFGLRGENMILDNVENDSLVDDGDWITPSHSKGYLKLRLTDSISIYYHFKSHYVFFNVVLSFDSLGTNSPRTLPSLFYGFVDMLDIWEKLGVESEDDSE